MSDNCYTDEAVAEIKSQLISLITKSNDPINLFFIIADSIAEKQINETHSDFMGNTVMLHEKDPVDIEATCRKFVTRCFNASIMVLLVEQIKRWENQK